MTQTETFTRVKLLLSTVLFFTLFLINAQTTVDFKPRYTNSGINGDLTMIGNSIVGNGTLPYNGESNNNSFVGQYINIDPGNGRFSSSSATLGGLTSCDRIVYAGLYWGANITSAWQTPETIQFKVPNGNYVPITADTSITEAPNERLVEQLDLMYYKDVTSYVATLPNPAGEYFVADVSCAVVDELGNSLNAGNRAAGWTMVIVYESPTKPRKFISTFDGFSNVSPGNTEQFSYSGFVTPPVGNVQGRIGIGALEGDRNLQGEQLFFADALLPDTEPNSSFDLLFDAENPATNFFNSKITIDGAQVIARNPASTNTLGWDTAIVDLDPLNNPNSPLIENLILANGATDATVRVATTGDRIFTFLNTFAVDIIEPVIDVLTSVEDTSGNAITLGSPVSLGAEVVYNINFENSGTDGALNTEVVNTLPFNVTLDETTIEFLDETGTPLAAGLITYIYNTTSRQLTFTIDDSLVLKDGLAGSYNIRYQVTASNDCFDYTDACTNLLENILETSYDGETSGTNITAQPGLNGVNGCGLGNPGSMDLFVNTSSCNFDSTLTFCNNNLTLTGDDGYNLYEWVNELGANVGNTKVITVTGPGIYTVTQTRVGCSVTTRVVTVLGLDVTFTPSNNLCKDSADGTIAVQVNEASANFTYELIQGGSTIATTGAITVDNYVFTGLDIGTYSVRVTNAAGCFDLQTGLTVTEPPLLQASNVVSDDIMPCNGNSLTGRIEVSAIGGTQFTATSDYEYSMDGGAFQESNIFETTVQGNHTITVRDANNCSTTTIANVGFDDEIDYNITKLDVNCANSTNGSIAINVTQNNAGNNLTYSIDNGATFQNSSTFSNLGVGSYDIIIRKVKGKNECETTVTESVDQLIFLEFDAVGGFSCEGGSSTITATVAAQYANEVTYILDGTLTNTTGIFENVSSGMHSVTARHNTFLCQADPIEINVASYTAMTILGVTPAIDNPNQYEIVFSGGNPDYQYAMLPGEIVNVTVEDNDFKDENVFNITADGFYTFFVKDANGCIVEYEEELEFSDIEIPNFFTPNGDTVNDEWYPRNISPYPNITVEVFDRYQRLIVKYEGIDNAWDGSYDGKPLPSGDYWYVIRLNSQSDDREFKGNVTLYR